MIVAGLPEPQFLDPEWVQPTIGPGPGHGHEGLLSQELIDSIDWGEVGMFVVKAAVGAAIGHYIEPYLP